MTDHARSVHLPTRTAIFRWLGIFACAALVVIIALYALTPYLVSTFAPQIGKRLGLTTLEVIVGYPGPKGVEVHRLFVESDDFVVHGEQAHMSYSWSELWQGKVDRLAFARLEISQLMSPEKAPQPEGVSTGINFPAHPFRTILVDQLVFQVPSTGFVGEGSAELGAAGLNLSMSGVEPAIARRFSLLAMLSPQGVFDARFGASDDPSAEYLGLRGEVAGSVIKLSGNFNLSGYPLQLVSATAQVPAGAGTVSGTFITDLPWPLPDTLLFSDVDMAMPSLVIDWSADDKTLILDKLSGSVTLRRGEGTAALSGAVYYDLGGRKLQAQLPPGYTLEYQQGTLSGADGLRVTLTDADTRVRSTLSSFSFRSGPNPAVKVEGDLETQINDAIIRGTVTGTLRDSELEINTRLSADRKARETDTDLWSRGRGSVAATLRTRIPSPWPEKLEWRDWDIDVPSYAIDWKSVKDELLLQSVKGKAHLKKRVITATTQGVVKYRSGEKMITARFPAGYALKHEGTRLSGKAGLVVSYDDQSSHAGVTVQKFSVNTAKQTQLEFESQVAARISGNDTGGTLKGRMTLTDTKVLKALGDFSYAGWADTPIDRQDLTLAVDFGLGGNALTASGNLTTAHFVQLPFNLGYDVATSAGHLDAQHTFNFRQPVAAAFMKDWQEVYDLDSGQIAMTLSLKWLTLEAINADVTLDVSDGKARYADNTAAGIGGRLFLKAEDATSSSSWRLEPSLLDIARVDIGLPLNAARVTLAWSGEQVHIDSASAQVLGGTARASPFVYNLTTGNAMTLLTLEKISLAAILALEGDDIVGTGSLSGTLPVTINNHQISISKGEMIADSPGGVLQLKAKIPGPKEQPSLNFALNALKDFTYTGLTSHIDYAENGDLTLAVRLDGRNPAVEKGRAIRYNLNVTENVPVLLQSLRMQNELTKRIEKKVIK